MGKQAVDLFDNAPWSTGEPADKQPARSPRPLLVVSLVLVGLLMSSMALPWFTSGETPAWTPFSHWLNLGWSPGSQKWGFLVLALGAAAAIAIGVAISTPRKVPMSLLLLVASSLLVATLLEGFAHLAVNPGPNLHADYGTWVGSVAAVLAWVDIAVAAVLARKASTPMIAQPGQ
jgi:hypothetical protein